MLAAPRREGVTLGKPKIVVLGTGGAGLTAAITFGAAGFKTICVDPTPPVTERDRAGSDLRTTAFLQPARQLLEDVGLWLHAQHRGHAQLHAAADPRPQPVSSRASASAPGCAGLIS